MYCKKCGKEITEESTFCFYCGEKQQIELSPINDSVEAKKTIGEIAIETPSIAKKSNANIVADEIISNLKMIGLALLISAVFIGIFWTCHIKDRKPVSENYYGYSCYDPVMMTYRETNWEKVLDEIKQEKVREEIKYFEAERKRKEDSLASLKKINN